MKSLLRWVAVFNVIAILFLTGVVEARIGGGRSSGFRGSRGFSTRPAPSMPRQVAPPPSNYGASQPMSRPPGAYGSPSPGGGFLRNLGAGLAGGFIGSMLFSRFGNGGTGMAGGGGGIGLFEILLLAGLAYFAFRFFLARPAAAQTGAYTEPSAFQSLRSVDSGPYVTQVGSDALDESSWGEVLRRSDPQFNLSIFKEERMDDFVKFQSAWNGRDLTQVAGQMGPELKAALELDIARLKSASQINRIENISVRGSELLEAWQENGSEYATLRFRANLLDFTIDENSGAVVAGDRNQPIKFEENWTFVRPVGGFGGQNSWKLTAIEA